MIEGPLKITQYSFDHRPMHCRWSKVAARALPLRASSMRKKEKEEGGMLMMAQTFWHYQSMGMGKFHFTDPHRTTVKLVKISDSTEPRNYLVWILLWREENRETALERIVFSWSLVCMLAKNAASHR